MKTPILSCLFFVLLSGGIPFTSIAQPRVKEGKVFIYKAIITTDTNYKIKAWLYDADDTQLHLAAAHLKNRPIDQLEATLYLPIDQVKTIKVRRKGSFHRAALRGGIIGFGVGTIAALILSEVIGQDQGGNTDGPWNEMAAGAAAGVYASLLSIPLGYVAKEKFRINGDSNQYKAIRDQLRAYSIKAQLE